MFQFYLKAVGTILLLGAGSGLGYSYGLDLVKRIEELKSIQQMLLIIQGDIRYGSSSMEEILVHMKGHTKAPYTNFIENILSKIQERRGDTFAALWEGAMKQELGNSKLKKEDKELFLQVGRSIGSVDKTQQISVLEMYQQEITSIINHLMNEKQNKQKMYHYLGIGGSMFLVILLF